MRTSIAPIPLLQPANARWRGRWGDGSLFAVRKSRFFASRPPPLCNFCRFAVGSRAGAGPRHIKKILPLRFGLRSPRPHQAVFDQVFKLFPIGSNRDFFHCLQLRSRYSISAAINLPSFPFGSLFGPRTIIKSNSAMSRRAGCYAEDLTACVHHPNRCARSYVRTLKSRSKYSMVFTKPSRSST